MVQPAGCRLQAGTWQGAGSGMVHWVQVAGRLHAAGRVEVASAAGRVQAVGRVLGAYEVQRRQPQHAICLFE